MHDDALGPPPLVEVSAGWRHPGRGGGGGGGGESAIVGPRLFARFIYYPLTGRSMNRTPTCIRFLAGLSDVVNRHIYTTRVLDPETRSIPNPYHESRVT